MTCAALGSNHAFVLGDANRTPPSLHPLLAEFGLTREQVPESVYLVRTPDTIPADAGVVVHAGKGDYMLVSGPPEAIARLAGMRNEVMPVDLSTYARPAPARVWRRVTVADPTIQRAVDAVTWEGVLPRIQMLVDFGQRSECCPSILTGAVPESLAVFFRGLGLDVVLQEYKFDWAACTERPTGLNVIATQEGVDHPDSMFVICAHYDSYLGPGADDNASGVAAVMTAAELLSRHRFAYTIQYVCFGHEEYRAAGSRDFVARLRDGPVNLIGALNFDMIGYWKQGAVFDLEVEASAPSVWLAEALVNAAELYTDTPCDTHITDIAMSDNGQFWQAGYPALNCEEAWIIRERDFNACWHKRCDRIELLHPGFTVANVRVAVAALATLARPWKIPAVVDISPKTLNLNSEGRWISGRIELPEGYDVGELDVSSIRLNETVAADPRPAVVGDADKNGDPDLVVKFSRTEVVGVLGKSESAQLRVSGLVGGECFEGSDTIRVVWSAGREKVAAFDSEPPRQFELFQNFPNPFNPTTTILFVVPEKVRTKLVIFDVQGTHVATLVDDVLDPGLKEYTWDAKDDNAMQVSTGVYFYCLTAGDKTLTKKMVLLK